jgi:PBP1b-binding outer membrane lipoprotein LpoB
MKPDLNWGALAAVAVCALVLTGCATENDERDSMGSHLAQPPHGVKRTPPTDAGDIALVGQDAAQAILQLPAISEASTPPLVKFNGVTSIINPPIDTTPYTELLRDRLLLLTREKLRFVEHTLPPYSPGGHKKHVDVDNGDAEYQVLAEMRGQPKAPTYKIQIEFIESGSGNILFNQTYRISKEDEGQPSADSYTPPMAPQTPGQQAPASQSSEQPKNTSGVNTNGDPNNPPPGYYEPKPSTGNGSGGGVL